MCASRVSTCNRGVCGYALYESLLTYVAHMDLVGDLVQGACHACASKILITIVRKIST